MRLIDADELMEHVWRDRLDSRERIAQMIDNAPTIKKIPIGISVEYLERMIYVMEKVQNQERKTGRWIRGDAEKLTGKWRCSICGNTIYSETKRDREKFHAFCGHCGADMRGGA